MTKPGAKSKSTKGPGEPFIPAATADDPDVPDESANASLPNEGSGTPILHKLPPSSGSAGAKKG